ncbi:MAG: SdpI family protein [Clostridia bacterium]|nr:SdpI family protein [Clostridia bacterium]
MKNYLKVIYVLIAVAAVNLIVMLSLIPNLPESIPVHFNYRFEVDRMGTRWFLAVIPSITLVFSIAMMVEQKIRGKDYANNKPLTVFAVAFVAFFIALGWVLYAMSGTGAQMGDTTSMPMDLIIGLGMSALFIVMGNYLPTVKQNRTFGIKMRATFESEEVWKKTHRYAGRAYVLGGFFTMFMSLIGYFIGASWLIFVGLILGVFGSNLVILIYALRLDRKMREA